MTTETGKTIHAEEAETIRKEEVVDLYAALLDKIWQRAQTILGLVTIRAILYRAIRLTARQHPFVEQLSVGNEGLNMGEIHAHVGDRDKEAIRQGFEELILNLFGMLAELTGEAIVNKLFRDDLAPSEGGSLRAGGGNT